MQNINFPVNFQFKISTLSNDFIAKDAGGSTIAYVKQKMFKFKEDVNIYNDESQSKIIYNIKADRWLDFSAAYSFYDENGVEFGKIARKGFKSIWKSHYEIIDQFQNKQYEIAEENPWIKVADQFLAQIPLIGILAVYLLNPAYIVTDLNGQQIVKLKKLPSLFGRKFELTKIGNMDSDDDDRIMLGLMMMILLERRRG